LRNIRLTALYLFAGRVSS